MYEYVGIKSGAIYFCVYVEEFLRASTPVQNHVRDKEEEKLELFSSLICWVESY